MAINRDREMWHIVLHLGGGKRIVSGYVAVQIIVEIDT